MAAETADGSRLPRADRREANPAPGILLLGAGGRLGQAIAQALGRHAGHWRVATPGRDALGWDSGEPDATVRRWFDAWQPSLVVNCIAASDVDACERDPRHAHSLNAILPAALARAAATDGARLVHFSTDFVFDGALRRPYREDDPARPLSEYGASKLLGERAIAASGAAHWIFRVSWLYGAPHANLAATLLDASNEGRVVRLSNDRFGVPNPVQLLAGEVVECIARETAASPQVFARATVQAGTAAHVGTLPPSGVYHLSCRGATTWYEFGLAFVQKAVRAGRLAAARAPRLEAFDEAALARPARRPAWSALDPGLYERSFGRTMPHWHDAIAVSFGSAIRR